MSGQRQYNIVNEVAQSVGEKWGVTIQVNLPAGGARSGKGLLGHENLSLLLDRGRKKFRNVTEVDVRHRLEGLGCTRFEPAGHDYEGFRSSPVDSGMIICLPGAVHLWCSITPNVMTFLDWLFVEAFELKPILG